MNETIDLWDCGAFRRRCRKRGGSFVSEHPKMPMGSVLHMFESTSLDSDELLPNRRGSRTCGKRCEGTFPWYVQRSNR